MFKHNSYFNYGDDFTCELSSEYKTRAIDPLNSISHRRMFKKFFRIYSYSNRNMFHEEAPSGIESSGSNRQNGNYHQHFGILTNDFYNRDILDVHTLHLARRTTHYYRKTAIMVDDLMWAVKTFRFYYN